MTEKTVQELESLMHTAVLAEESHKILPLLKSIIRVLPYRDQAIMMSMQVLIGFELGMNSSIGEADREEIFGQFKDLLERSFKLARNERK